MCIYMRCLYVILYIYINVHSHVYIYIYTRDDHAPDHTTATDAATVQAEAMNLFLNDEGVIKLGDFGVSRQMSECLV